MDADLGGTFGEAGAVSDSDVVLDGPSLSSPIWLNELVTANSRSSLLLPVPWNATK